MATFGLTFEPKNGPHSSKSKPARRKKLKNGPCSLLPLIGVLFSGVTWVDDNDKDAWVKEKMEKDELLDISFGYPRLNESNTTQTRTGYLFNMKPAQLEDKENARMKACVDYYFVEPVPSKLVLCNNELERSDFQSRGCISAILLYWSP